MSSHSAALAPRARTMISSSSPSSLFVQLVSVPTSSVLGNVQFKSKANLSSLPLPLPLARSSVAKCTPRTINSVVPKSCARSVFPISSRAATSTERHRSLDGSRTSPKSRAPRSPFWKAPIAGIVKLGTTLPRVGTILNDSLVGRRRKGPSTS